MAVPIYARYYPRVERPELYVGETDLELAWSHLSANPNKLNGAFNLLDYHHIPNICFVGSSHVVHLLDYKHQSNFPARHAHLMSRSHFVGVGGLKWHTAQDELNGIFTSHHKYVKYGNQWYTYDSKHKQADYYITVVGSNDADDFNILAISLLPYENEFTYLRNVEDASREWLSELKPHIFHLFNAMRMRSQHAALYYIPIIQRDYWCKQARDFDSDLDHYIFTGLYNEYGIKVKSIPTRSLYNYPAKLDVPCDMYDDVISAFLKEDGLHLNYWGMEVLLNDIAPPVIHNWHTHRSYASYGTY